MKEVQDCPHNDNIFKKLALVYGERGNICRLVKAYKKSTCIVNYKCTGTCMYRIIISHLRS